MKGKSNAGPATSLAGQAVSATAPVSGQVLGFNGTAWAGTTPGAGGLAIDPATIHHRLSVVTGVPVPTTDQVGVGTLYLTPFIGQVIALYDGTNWIGRTTAEISLALAGLTAGKNYDVFAYWTGAAVALELSAAWTNDTTRADALARQDGVLIKSGTTTRRYVGTFRATAAATTEDSNANRFVYSYANKVQRASVQADTTASWSQTDGATSQMNAGDADWTHSFVTGGLEDLDPVEVTTSCIVSSTGNQGMTMSTRLDGVEIKGTDSQDITGGGAGNVMRVFGKQLCGIGYRQFTTYTFVNVAGDTWTGNNNYSWLKTLSWR